MFFFATVLPREKELPHQQAGVCPACGAFGSYRVFLRYTCLALFFIPLFRWNRHYYVQMSCCHALYELDPEVGKAIARGEALEITPADLTPLDAGNSGQPACPHCGAPLESGFAYCPHCGQRLR